MRDVEGKVGLRNLRLIISLLLSASLVLDIKRLKEKTGDFFPPNVCPTPLSFSTLKCKCSLERLSVIPNNMNKPNHQISATILGKMRFVWGGDREAKRIFKEENPGTLGSCGSHEHCANHLRGPKAWES